MAGKVKPAYFFSALPFRPLGRHLVSVSVLIGLAWLLFFYRLGERHLGSSHEARAGQNAQTILHTGNWGLPRHFNNRLELQKPPLYYWLVAGIAHLHGGQVDAWAVRLPAALSALGCLLVLYLMGVKQGRPHAGFWAATILATFFHFTWLARVGRIDMPLTLAVTLVLAGFYLADRASTSLRAGKAWILVAYLAMGAGLLLKGPIAALLPAFVLSLWWLLEKYGCQCQTSFHRIASTLWWGIPLVLVVAAPWFIWACFQTKNEVWRVFFWHHNVERALGGSATLSAHPWWFYWPRLVLDMLPWSLFMPVAALVFVRQKSWRVDAEARFGLVWLAGILFLLSLASFKRADYLLPAYPGAALWLGCTAERFFRERNKTCSDTFSFCWPRLHFGWGPGLIVAGCAIGWWIYLTLVQPGQEQNRTYQRFAQEIRRRTGLPVIFFRTEAHEVVFHVGRPLDTILEWENLDVWASQPQCIYVVMPPDCAAEWRRHLCQGKLEEVLRTSDLKAKSDERPLVLLRSVPRAIQ